eukprot:GHVU01019190.1.p2 GENE.GHVU01019190.1~~GHVU01019190.1.p2  ORF type:complete len:229 (+),score=39.80 GHVU01019190.1:913-1599(+)
MFLADVQQSRPMQLLYKVLTESGAVDEDYESFMAFVRFIWFTPYKRSSVKGGPSSGFKHVFCGELRKKGNKATGFHNWVRFYDEERKGALRYLGFWPWPKPTSTSPTELRQMRESKSRLIATRFTWYGKEKKISSLFIGTSPEFELALYTYFFFRGRTYNRARIRDYSMFVIVHRKPSSNGDVVAAIYPGYDAKEKHVRALGSSRPSSTPNCVALLAMLATAAMLRQQ